MKPASMVLVAAAVMTLSGTSLVGQSQPPKQLPRAVTSTAEETLELWNDIGNRIVAMAQDFPEDKYDFKVQKDQRSFAQNILHVAGVDYIMMRSVAGSSVGPDLGRDPENPSRDVYKTKADVVKLIQQAVADGANLINQQGEAGMAKTSRFAFGNRMVHASYTWASAVEHSGEHYGQLVVYYRANNMVPPASRPR